MKRKFSINADQYKIIGIILMSFDHLNSLLPLELPIWFGWLGRPVAIMFLYTTANGARYTRNIYKYMFNLLVGYWVVSIISYFIGRYLPVAGVELYGNIFGPLFLSVLYIKIIQELINSIKAKNLLRIVLTFICLFIPILISYATLIIFNVNLNLGVWLLNLIPNVLISEGGFTYIIPTVLFYLARDNKLIKILIVVIFSMITFILALNTPGSIFFDNYQWMMIVSLIPIVLYDEGKGKLNKYFFYVYYPAHMFIIYLVGYLMSH